MYFSDEIKLLSKSYTVDGLGQYTSQDIEKSVFSDLTSVTGDEKKSAGQSGINATARAVLHVEDYNGEEMISYAGGAALQAGKYSVYRTYFAGDTVELYLTQKAGG